MPSILCSTLYHHFAHLAAIVVTFHVNFYLSREAASRHSSARQDQEEKGTTGTTQAAGGAQQWQGMYNDNFAILIVNYI